MCQRAAAVTIAIIIAREEFRMQNATMNNRANITVHRTSDSIAEYKMYSIKRARESINNCEKRERGGGTERKS